MTMAERDSRADSVSPPAAQSTESASAQSADDYLNRDLQWLEFNDRVLFQAEDPAVPLLERVRFLSIFSNNLDEFFMKRVGALRRQMELGIRTISHENLSPEDLLVAIRERVIPQTRRKWHCWKRQLVPALRERGIEFIPYAQLEPADRTRVQTWFQQTVFPLLTPLAVDPGHRFPFISNLSTSLGIMLRRPDDEAPLFARIKVPEVVTQWHRFGSSMHFVSVLDVIEHNLDVLFPGMEILEVLPFRITRNADTEGDEEDSEDILEQIQQQLRERRFAPIVRLQINRVVSRNLHDFLCEAMEIDQRDIYETRGLINFRSLDEIADLPLFDLRHPPWKPIMPPRLRDREQDIFSVIRQGDVLVHHPYESFDCSVERFVEEAADDPNVLGIKQALYRTSGDSPFIRSLIRAAEAGKQVAVLIELRARFDEARNIRWANKLEDAGVHVAYGVVGLKTHAKITLVVRRDADALRSYAHLGTGNYNSNTARIYEDVGLLTCNPAITGDVIDLFNFITGRSHKPVYERLLVAPHHMKRQFLALIEREIELHADGRPGRIIAKMNQLQDRDIIQALYRASQAGVRTDLIIRGFCTLRPGVPGLSENIRVISIIGRFLEHSRIFWFRAGADDPLDGEYFISSADWMYRNLEARVEAACPIEDRQHRQRLWQTLQTCLMDRRQAWEMHPDGRYTLRMPDPESADTSAVLGTQHILAHTALESARLRYRPALPELPDSE